MRLWTVVLEISVLMAQFPSREIAQLSYELPHAGPGLRQSRRAVDVVGHFLRLRRGRQIAGALTAILSGVSYATSAEMAGDARRLPRLQEESRAHAARHPQPPPRRARRAHRL